jgi:hypothetical protein
MLNSECNFDVHKFCIEARCLVNKIDKGDSLEQRFILMKKTLDYCISDLRWVCLERMSVFKKVFYSKLNEIIDRQDLPEYIIKYVKQVKTKLQLFELVYEGCDRTYKELEKLYYEDVKLNEEDEEFEKLYTLGESVNDNSSEEEEFEKLYGQSSGDKIVKFYEVVPHEQLYEEEHNNEELYEKEDDHKLDKENLFDSKKIIDLSTLNQTPISILNISPIVCML